MVGKDGPRENHLALVLKEGDIVGFSPEALNMGGHTEQERYKVTAKPYKSDGLWAVNLETLKGEWAAGRYLWALTKA